MSVKIPRGFFISLLSGFLIFLSVSLLFRQIDILSWLTGYFIGVLAVILHLLFSHIGNQVSQDKFITYYYAGLFIRFLAVIVLFIILLLVTNLDEFSFTVSFIISYIFHSVNEVIFLNEKLKN